MITMKTLNKQEEEDRNEAKRDMKIHNQGGGLPCVYAA